MHAFSTTGRLQRFVRNTRTIGVMCALKCSVHTCICMERPEWLSRRLMILWYTLAQGFHYNSDGSVTIQPPYSVNDCTVWVFCTVIHWWRWLYSHRNIWITVKTWASAYQRIINSLHLVQFHLSSIIKSLSCCCVRIYSAAQFHLWSPPLASHLQQVALTTRRKPVSNSAYNRIKYCTPLQWMQNSWVVIEH